MPSWRLQFFALFPDRRSNWFRVPDRTCTYIVRHKRCLLTDSILIQKIVGLFNYQKTVQKRYCNITHVANGMLISFGSQAICGPRQTRSLFLYSDLMEVLHMNPWGFCEALFCLRHIDGAAGSVLKRWISRQHPLSYPSMWKDYPTFAVFWNPSCYCSNSIFFFYARRQSSFSNYMRVWS